MSQWYNYIVRCKNGALYTGITTDVGRRVEQHNKSIGAKAVKALGLPVYLEWHDRAITKTAAMRIEYIIKKLTKAEKEKFLKRLKWWNTIV